MNKRKAAFVLALISGITGSLVSLLALVGGLFFSSIDSSTLINAELTAEDAEMLTSMSGKVVVLAGITLIFSVIIFIMAFLLRKTVKTRICGISLLILSIIPFFLLIILWVIPGILGVISGIMLLVRKKS
ncbi:DUF4064 domain-containing protein [Enterococcus sp. DIV1420a]|uniref:DUF4064 domain-containing protein n=1 Tax=Enterococcus sp. DIV1420a TaxID=2774672 RepID=UPI003F28FF21